MAEQRGAGSRWLRSFANAVIGLGLPTVRRWLQGRFGPGAQLESIALVDGRAQLTRARLPLAGQLVLQVAEAQFELGRHQRVEDSTKLVLVHLDGELIVEGGDGRPHFCAPIKLVPAERRAQDAWVAGTLLVAGAYWTTHRGVGEPQPLDGSIEVEISLARWSLANGSFRSAAADITLSARGSMDNSAGRGVQQAQLSFRQARAGHLIDALAALMASGVPNDWPLPWEAEVTGELRYDHGTVRVDTLVNNDTSAAVEGAGIRLPSQLHLLCELTYDGGARGTVTLDSPSSSLRFAPLTVGADGALDGTELRGSLSWRDGLGLGLSALPVQPAVDGAMTIALSLSGRGDTLAARGEVRAEHVAVVRAAGPGSVRLDLHDIAVSLDITRRLVRYPKLALSVRGSRIHGGGAYALRELDASAAGDDMHGAVSTAGDHHTAAAIDQNRLVLRFVEVGGGAFAELLTLAGLEAAVAAGDAETSQGLGLPVDLRVTGELVLTPANELGGEVAFETTTSLLLSSWHVSQKQPLDGSTARELVVDGSTVRGRLSVRDAQLLGIPLSEWIASDNLLHLEAELSGKGRSLSVRGDIRAPNLTLRVFRSEQSPELLVEDLRVRIERTPRSLTWSRLTARCYGGVVTSSGVWNSSGELRTRTDISRVDVGLLPLGREQAAIGQYLGGLATGTMSLKHGGGDDDGYIGSGELRIDEPHYPALKLVEPKLREVGLPLPPLRGQQPLTTKLDLDVNALRAVELNASVPACRVDGGLQLFFDGTLAGDVRLHLAKPYLQKSALLTIPTAVTGALIVPTALGGTLAAPEVRAEVMAAIREALARGPVGSTVNQVGAAVAGASSAVATTLGELAKDVEGMVDTLFDEPAPSRREPEDAMLAALVDRIMRDAPNADELIDRLIDAGVSADDIVRILEERRLRMGRP